MDDKQIKIEMRAAIKRCDLEVFSKYYSENENLRDVNTTFGTWLHMAASVGCMGIVEFLITQGSLIDAKSGIRRGTPLNDAASEGHLEVVEYLISKGAVLDVSDPEKNPLFGAILKGNIGIVKTLIKHGIDYSKRYTGESMKNMNAAMFARERGMTEIARYIESL